MRTHSLLLLGLGPRLPGGRVSCGSSSLVKVSSFDGALSIENNATAPRNESLKPIKNVVNVELIKLLGIMKFS